MGSGTDQPTPWEFLRPLFRPHSRWCSCAPFAAGRFLAQSGKPGPCQAHGHVSIYRGDPCPVLGHSRSTPRRSAKPRCAMGKCRKKPMDKCYDCKTSPLCKDHAVGLCPACETLQPRQAQQAERGALTRDQHIRLNFGITCYMPVDNTVLYVLLHPLSDQPPQWTSSCAMQCAMTWRQPPSAKRRTPRKLSCGPRQCFAGSEMMRRSFWTGRHRPYSRLTMSRMPSWVRETPDGSRL